MPDKLQTPQDLRQTLLKFYSKPVAQVSLELFLSLATIIFFAVFAIRPTLLTMSDLLKEIDDKKQLDQQLTNKVAALSTVQTEFISLQNRFGALHESLPNQPELITSMKVIEKIASDLDLVILSISVPEIPEETTVDLNQIEVDDLKRIDLPISISVTGTYPVIRQYIENLMNYRRTFIVDTIIFNTQKRQGVTNLEARITVTIPYFSTNNPLEKKP